MGRGTHGAKIRMWAGLAPSGSSGGESVSLPSQLLEAAHIPWPAASSSTYEASSAEAL